MHPSITEDRVKPCLHCDQLIPYFAEECPSCRTPARSQIPALLQTAARRQDSVDSQNLEPCEGCSEAVEPESIFCPACGELNVSIDAMPEIPREKAGFPLPGGRSLEFGITCLECVAVLALFWVIIDHMTL